MGHKRWKYTEGGKPLPGGPVEVDAEPEAPGVRIEMPQEAPRPKPAMPGGWADFSIPGGK